MADWKTYAKAAANTARKQAPDAKKAAQRSLRNASIAATAAGRTAKVQTEQIRKDARQASAKAVVNASAYSTVAARKMRQARLKQRFLAAVRDAVLMALSVVIIWFVITKTGVPIPITAVVAVIVLIALLRFGVVFFSKREDDPAGYDPERDG
ncbi:hypothetical protein ACUH94_03720 [Dermabacteraceae bacterium P7074]